MNKNSKKENGNRQTKKTRKGIAEFAKKFRRDWQLHVLMILPVVYMGIFYYWPMYGAQIAFRNYRAKKGITGSEWVGLKWFQKFLTNYNFKQIFTNTLVLSFYSIIVIFVLSIVLALLLNTVRNERFKKFVQSVTYIPHFISIVVVVSMVNMILNPMNGLYNTFFHLFGGEGYPTDFRATASAFRSLYVWSGVWQDLGWETIIYIAALSSVSADQHEAAMIDGANRWQRILHVDLPAILPTACIMLILRCGSVMSVGFEKTYLMQTSLNLPTSEVISTYVYKVAMGNSKDFSYAAAIDLFNSIINCIMLLTVNFFSKKATDGETSLF